MGDSEAKSEIRDSIIRDLIDKVRKRNYKHYLVSIRLEKARMFSGAEINFDFPVTALIGPNGGGKSTILGAAACAYSNYEPRNIFRKSRVGDESMDNWSFEYEVVDKSINPKGTVRTKLSFQGDAWTWDNRLQRDLKLIGITRTLPMTENPMVHFRRKISTSYKGGGPDLAIEKMEDINHIKREAERILGKSLAYFDLYRISSRGGKKVKRVMKKVIVGYRIVEGGAEVPVFKSVPTGEVKKKKGSSIQQFMYVGGDGHNSYSEFNFGAGESSIIRLVAEIESLPDSSLILIEEIENGLHPLAVRRTVEYLIDAARRKSCQVVFTTHSDYAIEILPSEAIWASIDGRLQQGKLSIEVLRAVSGRVDKRLAIFVEDNFAKAWVEAILRDGLGNSIDEIGVYAVSGDGNAVKIHLGHMNNPAVAFHSICFIDGDSPQKEDPDKRIYRLPGLLPESTVFNSVVSNLESNVALLTVACQLSPGKQNMVSDQIKKVSHSNRDPHLLFNQIGIQIGFVPEAIVRGAFITVWIQENTGEVLTILDNVKPALSLPPKMSV